MLQKIGLVTLRPLTIKPDERRFESRRLVGNPVRGSQKVAAADI
jgi:hypothetical protein